MKKSDHKRITRDFRIRQSRQFFAGAVTLALMVALALIYSQSFFPGVFSRSTIVGLQIITVAAFIGFTAVNWRCPSCRKYLGPDIGRQTCKKCGIGLR